MNRWIALGLLVGTAAAAQPRAKDASDCEDAYLECKEDCLIKWGGTTDLKKRAKNNQCINKCEGVDRDCREAFLETKRNNLDEGSLNGSPSSRDVDSDGMPTKTAKQKPPPPKDDDVREDDKPAPKQEKAPAPKPELAAEETPKSNRTSLKTDPKDKPVDPPKPAEKPAEKEKVAEKKREEPPPRREEPPPRRDDPPPKREEAKPPSEDAPPPPKKEKREEKRDESKKKERALDEWDPDAL